MMDEAYQIASIPRGPVVWTNPSNRAPTWRHKSALPSTVSGPLGEAHAMAHLAGQGYHVFVGFGNTPCDLIAMRGSEMIRVEVKTTTGTSDQGVYNMPPAKPDLHDMLIWVIPTEGILIVNPTRGWMVG